MKGSILIVEDHKGVAEALRILLAPEFDKVDVITNPNALPGCLERNTYNLILLDMNFRAGMNSGNEGIFWLREIRKKSPETEVVMITAYGDVDLAVTALKEGAADFVLKPWDNAKMMATAKAAFRQGRARAEIAALRTRESFLKHASASPSQPIVWKSRQMGDILDLIRKVAPTEANVLITGENGTGKELIAKEIHKQSTRRNEVFVMADLASLTESLFESELFGHKKGAFTHALEDKTGRFILAQKGTLFLDEIGNLPVNLQAKLLSVLQTRVVTPVGSVMPVKVDIRLISATNRNLSQMISEGQFRQDLLYRMNTIQIHLPPLRERPDDVDALVPWFLDFYSRKYGKPCMSVDHQMMELLRSNPWPGNIRELQHAVEKAVILSEHDKLSKSDFSLRNTDLSLQTEPGTLSEMETRMIIQALGRNNHNLSAAAEQLGITRQTLYNKIRKYGL